MLRMSLMSFLLEGPNLQWCNSVGKHSVVENKSTNGMVCHKKDLPGFSHDHKIPLSQLTAW